MQKRRMAGKKSIKKFWKEKILEMKKDIFQSADEFDRHDYCFACGMVMNNTTERAHILAKCEGGSDDVDNLHLLCKACHLDSESLDGESYFDWFLKRTHVDTFLTIAYKQDYVLFKTFREKANELKRDHGIDAYSVDFLNKINRARLIQFDLTER